MAEQTRVRFWGKVDRSGGRYACWPWMGALFPAGYGQLSIDNRTSLAHRFAFQDMNGPIPVGASIDHLCRVRACQNPTHMEPVSLVENVMRGVSPHAINARKTHCKCGHEYDGARMGHGKLRRYCKPCHIASARKSRRGR